MPNPKVSLRKHKKIIKSKGINIPFSSPSTPNVWSNDSIDWHFMDKDLTSMLRKIVIVLKQLSILTKCISKITVIFRKFNSHKNKIKESKRYF